MEKLGGPYDGGVDDCGDDSPGQRAARRGGGIEAVEGMGYGAAAEWFMPLVIHLTHDIGCTLRDAIDAVPYVAAVQLWTGFIRRRGGKLADAADKAFARAAAREKRRLAREYEIVPDPEPVPKTGLRRQKSGTQHAQPAPAQPPGNPVPGPRQRGNAPSLPLPEVPPLAPDGGRETPEKTLSKKSPKPTHQRKKPRK